MLHDFLLDLFFSRNITPQLRRKDKRAAMSSCDVTPFAKHCLSTKNKSTLFRFSPFFAVECLGKSFK